PISCAAANAVLDIVTGEGFLIEVSEKGKYIKARIKEWGCSKILGVRGLGLMLGVEVPTEYGEPKALVAKMAKEGLLALTAGKNVIRLLPPLTISYEEIDSGLNIMRKVLEGNL
ncbi:MAG: aminotransferase class III-fold pyridoxal phosphate-dependent enzyme, partial [Bacillota bacterium]|nr:aminotransferase class III-fold pyridoxal phosphate-dependent enzyme [Bacillota bacterium]